MSPAEETAKPAEEKVSYSMSPGLAAFLGAQKIGLAISSYQSGKFYLLGQNVDGGLLVDERFFRKAMGICVPGPHTLLLATLLQIIKFRNVLDALPKDAMVVRPATIEAVVLPPIETADWSVERLDDEIQAIRARYLEILGQR